LAVEEQFYLLWPFLVFFLPRPVLKRLIFILIFLAPAFRLVMEGAFPHLHRVNYLPLSCGDSLGVGACLAFALRNETFFRAPASTIARHMGIVGLSGGIVMTILILLHGRTFRLETIGHTFLVFGFGWLVFGAARGFRGPLGQVLDRRELQFLGKISYGLYVFHHFFTYQNFRSLFDLAGLPSHWTENVVVVSVVRLVLTILLAAASWYLYEKPLNNLKRFFTLSNTLSNELAECAPPAMELRSEEVVPDGSRT
jgi:peptidoglycan/LPS O-acetylase OafA/YrhL